MRVISIITPIRIKAYCLFFFLLGGFSISAQTADEFCNCPDGFLTPVPPQAIQNGQIIASDLFRFSRIPARPPVVNRCFVIDKPLVFNEPWERFMNNCHFTMKPGGSIIISAESGGLHLRASSIKGCGQTWSGISTDSGGQLELENSEISDAISGVTIKNNTTVLLKGTDFENCSFGVQIDTNAFVTGTPIFGCTFKNCIIGLENSGNIFLGSELGQNRFEDCVTAILSKDGNLLVENTVIERCNTGLSTNNNESVEVKNTQFIDCFAAILDVNSNINIEENTFENNQLQAIDLRGHLLRSIEIRNNTINAGNGIKLANIFSQDLIVSNNKITPFGRFLSGISLLNVVAQEAVIDGNDILGDENLISSDGILTTNCSGLTISHNFIDSKAQLNVGIQIAGTTNTVFDQNTIYGGGTGSGIVLENSQVDLTCNRLFNHGNGISIKGFSRSNISTNEITNGTVGLLYNIGAITGPQIHNGNLWFGDFSVASAFHFNPDRNFYTLSSFFANGATPFATPKGVSPPEWFEDRNGRTKECDFGGKLANDNFQASLEEAFNEQLLRGDIYNDAENEALKFETARHLCQTGNYAIKADSKSGFIYETQTLEYLNQTKNSIKNLIDRDALVMINYVNQQKKMKNALDNLRLFQNRSAENALKNYDEQRDLINQLEYLIEDLKEARAELLSTIQKKSKVIQSDLNEVEINELFVNNEVFIQKMHLKILTEGIESISKEEKNQINKIAQSNVKTEGMIVYKARNLLYEIPKSPIVDHLDNDDHIVRPFTESLSDIAVEVFPNPASEVLNLRTSKRPVSYQVVSATGKVVKDEAVFNHQINIRNLNSGYYFIKMEMENGEIIQKKFSIIR